MEKKVMIHTISAMVHWKVASMLKKHASKLKRDYQGLSVLDMGGTGKLKTFLPDWFTVKDANIKDGFDGTKLSFEDKSFDFVVSIATVEHVENCIGFLDESVRIAKRGVLHWFPCGEPAMKTEQWKLENGHCHKCKILDFEVVKEWIEKAQKPNSWERAIGFMRVAEHLLLLSTINKVLNRDSMYDFIEEHGNNFYGYLVGIER